MSEPFPRDWIRARIGAFCSMRTGMAYSTNDVVDAGTQDAIACFRTSNIQEELDTSDVTFVPEHLVNKRDYYLRVGDILMSTANSNTLVGKCCLIRELESKSLYGGFISRIRIESKFLDTEFAYFWLSSNAIQAHLRNRARQTTNIANLPPSDVLATPIIIPPLSEQRRIVEILNVARDVRCLRQEADDVMSKLIPPIFDDMFGELDRTEFVPLKRLFSREPQNGLYKPAEQYGAGYPIVRIADFYGGKITKSGQS